MKIISKEEAGAMLVRKGSASILRTRLEAMKPGEVMLLERKDWHQKKNPPTVMCTQIRKRTGATFVVNVLASGEGWLIERV